MQRRQLAVVVAAAVIAAAILGFGIARAVEGGGGDDAAPPTATLAPAPSTTAAAEPTTAEAPPTTAEEPPVTSEPTATEEPPTTTEPATTVAPPPDMQAVVYLVRDERVAPFARTVPKADTVLRTALEELLRGSTNDEREAGASTAIPAGTTLLDVTLDDGVAVVDLSGAFDDGGGSLSMGLRLAQLVFTATRFPNVKGVRLLIDGEPVEALGGEGLIVSDPVTRADLEDASPQILVEEPLPGTGVACPVRVSGTSNVFEATSLAEVLGEDGARPDPTVVTATSGTGTRGTFAEDVPCPAGAAPGDALTLRLWSPSAEDGSEQFPVEVPVVVAG